MRRDVRTLVRLLVLAGALLTWRTILADDTPIVVGPDGLYASLAEAIAKAAPGSTIEVVGGVHPGPIVLDKPLTLIGRDWPVLEGNDEGTVVTLTAPDTTLQGFVIRGSGVEPDQSDAGLLVAGDQAQVLNNRLEDVLNGVYLADAADVIVRGNDITGKEAYELGRKGDGIRIWYSPNALIEDNHVHESRDMVVWYSPGATFRGNVVRNGRYGVHLMYTDDVTIDRNDFESNSVGIYAMYANGVTMTDNLVRRQRGPSGYALGFKDVTDVRVTGNVLVDNNAAIFLDGTPFTPGSLSLFEDNILAFNDVGVVLMPAVKGNIFRRNTLWENITQTALSGGGTAGENTWQDNFWSDYSGFDADADGRGDLPYRSDRFFESLTDREPRLRVLLYSPTAQAIEAAGMSFPLIRPQPKMTDLTPRMDATALPSFATPPADSRWGVFAAGLILLVVAAAGVRLGFREQW